MNNVANDPSTTTTTTSTIVSGAQNNRQKNIIPPGGNLMHDLQFSKFKNTPTLGPVMAAYAIVKGNRLSEEAEEFRTSVNTFVPELARIRWDTTAVIINPVREIMILVLDQVDKLDPDILKALCRVWAYFSYLDVEYMKLTPDEDADLKNMSFADLQSRAQALTADAQRVAGLKDDSIGKEYKAIESKLLLLIKKTKQCISDPKISKDDINPVKQTLSDVMDRLCTNDYILEETSKTAKVKEEELRLRFRMGRPLN
jgi:hypothetical protein